MNLPEMIEKFFLALILGWIGYLVASILIYTLLYRPLKRLWKKSFWTLSDTLASSEPTTSFWRY